MVQTHHREFEAPWGLAMVGWSEDRSEPLCAVGIFCTGVYLRCLRHLYPPPGKQRRWPGVCFGMCLTGQVNKKVAISPDSKQKGFSYKQLGVIHPSSPPMGRGHSLAQPWQRVRRLKKKCCRHIKKIKKKTYLHKKICQTVQTRASMQTCKAS